MFGGSRETVTKEPTKGKKMERRSRKNSHRRTIVTAVKQEAHTKKGVIGVPNVHEGGSRV